MPRSKNYTPKQLDFLRKKFPAMSLPDLTAAFNAKFGCEKTANQLRATLKNHRITCGRKGKDRLIPNRCSYTPGQLTWLRKNYPLHQLPALTERFNAKFGDSRTVKQIRSALHNRGYVSGRDNRFPKGQRPWNEGTKGVMKGSCTSFKPGNVPANRKPLGTERICSKDGFILIKVAERNPHTGFPTRYKHKHVWIWEQTHGPVPKGMCVCFRDGSRTNCDPANLMLLSRAELVRLNQKGYRKTPAELKPSVLVLVKLTTRIGKLEKGRGKEAR